MIKVNVATNSDGYLDIRIKGHAKPEVCNIVSALAQSSVNYMAELANQFPDELSVQIEEVSTTAESEETYRKYYDSEVST